MNSLTRVLAAIDGADTDRRALSLTLSLYGAKLTHCPLAQYYSDPKAYARGQSAVREAIAPDVLFGPFALALLGEAFGGAVRALPDQAPNLARPALASAADLSTLAVPDIDTHPCLTYFREAIQFTAEEHGRDVPIAAVTLNPVDLPIMLMGLDGWLETVLFDEAGTRRILEMTQPFFVEYANALFAAGTTVIVTPCAFANPSIISREIIQQTMLPALEASFAQVKGPLVIHSAGARLAPFLDLYSDLPNVAGAVINCGEDLGKARAQARPGLALIGNLDGPNLVHATANEIRKQCRALLRDRSGDPHFILGSSAADIPSATPLENILAIREAIQEAVAI